MSSLPETDKHSILLDFNIPIIFKYPVVKNDVTSTKTDTQLSKNIAYPKFSIGFQHFLHASRDKMNITENFKGKKKVYLVTNRFETSIDNYDNDIATVSKKFFPSEPLNDKFYELWEILCMFNLIDQTKIKSLHIGTENGSFAQAVAFYRNMIIGAKQDKYNVIKNKNINKLFDSYAKKNNKINIINKPTGDIDLITSQIDKKWKYENIQEQEMLPDFIESLITIIESQKKNGNAVIRMFECYSEPVLKLLCLLRTCYDNIYVVRPLTCKSFIPDRYVVCTGFNLGTNDAKNKIKQLNSMLAILKKDKTNMNIIDIFPKFKLSTTFKNISTKANTDISNRQFVGVNNVVKFIEDQNYHGDQYNKYNKEQQEAAQMWISAFLPKNKNKKSFESLRKWVNDIIKVNNERINKLAKVII